MSLLNVNKIKKNYGFNILLNDVSFNLNEGENISIVGPNGCGKSTLVKIIAGEETSDSGSISIKKDAKISYLKQINDEYENKFCYEVIKEGFDELISIENKIKKYEKLMCDGNENAIIKYCEALEKYNALGGYEINAKINEVCNNLNINLDLLNCKFNDLSGGEKTLIQLAKGLITNPDIFLLDEPTNHLDIERLELLENYIKQFKGAIVIVSHDRYFLDKMSHKILDLSDFTPKVYNMNYTNYLIEKEKEFQRQMADYKVQQQQIKKLEQEISYFLQKADQTKSSAMYDRAKQLTEKVNKIKTTGVKKPKVQRKIDVNFDSINKRSTVVFKTENLNVMKSNGDKIINNANIEIHYKDRIAFLGSNGSGKTTLINTILNKQKLKYNGNIIVGSSNKIGYLPQIIVFENPKLKVLDYFIQETHVNEEDSRRILNTFLFYNDNVMKKIGNLSEGEKIRLKLAILLQNSVNCLIFDEPTNHIDLVTKEVLEKAIETFDGTFIFVSHDRYFINKFANKILEFKNGNIKLFLGNYDNYLEKNNQRS